MTTRSELSWIKCGKPSERKKTPTIRGIARRGLLRSLSASPRELADGRAKKTLLSGLGLSQVTRICLTGALLGSIPSHSLKQTSLERRRRGT